MGLTITVVRLRAEKCSMQSDKRASASRAPVPLNCEIHTCFSTLFPSPSVEQDVYTGLFGVFFFSYMEGQNLTGVSYFPFLQVSQILINSHQLRSGELISPGGRPEEQSAPGFFKWLFSFPSPPQPPKSSKDFSLIATVNLLEIKHRYKWRLPCDCSPTLGVSNSQTCSP